MKHQMECPGCGTRRVGKARTARCCGKRIAYCRDCENRCFHSACGMFICPDEIWCPVHRERCDKCNARITERNFLQCRDSGCDAALCKRCVDRKSEKIGVPLCYWQCSLYGNRNRCGECMQLTERLICQVCNSGYTYCIGHEPPLCKHHRGRCVECPTYYYSAVKEEGSCQNCIKKRTFQLWLETKRRRIAPSRDVWSLICRKLKK